MEISPNFVAFLEYMNFMTNSFIDIFYLNEQKTSKYLMEEQNKENFVDSAIVKTCDELDLY